MFGSVSLIKSRSFKVCLDYAKRSFYRATNAIFGKTGRLASEEVILQLIVSKCMPILLYGLEACTLSLNYRHWIFTVKRFLLYCFIHCILVSLYHPLVNQRRHVQFLFSVF